MESPYDYFLRTARFGFRCWDENDFGLAHTLWGDPRVMKMIGGAYSEERTRKRLEQEIKFQQEFGFQYWPIFLLEADVFAGCCGLRPYKIAERTYELGVHLRPEFWGKGVAQEASRAVIAHAFRELNANALFAGHHPNNAASASLLKKLGFEFTHTELYPPTGLMHPSYLLPKPISVAANSG